MTLLTSVGLLGAVVAVGYAFCVLPTLRGSRPAFWPGSRSRRGAAAVTDLDGELASAREEVAWLRERAQQATRAADERGFSAERGGVQTQTTLAGPATLECAAWLPPGAAVTGWRRYFPVNMSRAEQVARVVAGLVIAVVTGLALPGAVAGAWGMTLIVVGWLAVADLVVSGLTAHSPCTGSCGCRGIPGSAREPPGLAGGGTARGAGRLA